MQITTRTYDPETRSEVETTLDLCECLPSVVRQGLEWRSLLPDEWVWGELLESA